ncbi:hypothetical protein V6N12_062835 [Hibiscus sabdariffa]|uniref:Uncharacterized protein n=1 Tax=Hibiscus sabdariffa TaxID=183260 RepID=A0ABR2FA03_9ROSI
MRQKKNCYTSRKHMIRGLCENSMVRLPATGSRQIKFCILEVPGNRLPNTGSNMAELKKKKKQEPGFMSGMINRAEQESSSIVAVKSYTEATWSIKAQNLSKQSFGPDFPASAEKRSIERDLNFINVFFLVSLFYERVKKKAETESKSKIRSSSALMITWSTSLAKGVQLY